MFGTFGVQLLAFSFVQLLVATIVHHNTVDITNDS